MDRQIISEIGKSKINRMPVSPLVESDLTAPENKEKLIGPLELKMRKTISGLKNTQYPDNFDWSIYDQIAKKFGDEQPRGSVVFKTAFRLVNYHSSCSKCHYAFEIDTYGRGCLHNCVYCYALEQLTAHGMWNRPHPFPLDMSEVRRVFYTVFETNKPSKWRTILEKRIPIRIGSMSDSFMWMDKKYGVTKELLKILSFYNYPYIIFTRSDLVASDEYLKLLRSDLSSVQFSISGNNDGLTKIIEPGAPSLSRRLNALRILNNAGFWTTVRINPFFPTRPDGYFSDPDYIVQKFGSMEKAPEFNFFDITLLDQIADTGTKSFLAGVVRLSPHSVRNISKATGLDYKSFFKLEDKVKSRDHHYSDKEVAHYYLWLRKEGLKKGLRFNTCYIGQGINDFYAYQSLWSNKSDCCDAKGNVKVFQSSSQQIDWDTREKFVPPKVHIGNSRVVDETYTQKYESNTANKLSTPKNSEEISL